MEPSSNPNIIPEHARFLGRSAREKLLGQRGLVVWLYGLSGSGKSTLATALERRLHAAGRLTAVLDGDIVRTGLNLSPDGSHYDLQFHYPHPDPA
jgi:adenylylsulfate kinase-like enzyme